MNTASRWRFFIRHPWATCPGSESLIMLWLFARLTMTSYDHYVKVSERLKPIAIISPQDPERAAMELRRAVKQLGYRAAVVRTTGLRLPLGHRFYDPIYREAEKLDCAIAV